MKPMKKLLLAAVLSGVCIPSFAQSVLSLEDAVIGRWTKYRTENLSNLQWQPESDSYSYIEADTLLRISSINGKNSTIAKSSLGLPELKRFPFINWTSKTDFQFKLKNSLYSYSTKSEKSEKVLSHDETGTHTDKSPDNAAIAYTIDNSLYIAKGDKSKIKVAESKEDGIVYGQAVHRFEFGISKGTFWSPDGSKLAFYRKDETMVKQYPIVHTNNRIAEVDMIRYPMAGETSHEVTLGIYNLKKKKTVYIKTGAPKDQYLTNIAWGPKGKYIYIAVLNRDQNHMKLNKYDVKTGKFVKTLFEEKQKTYVQPLHHMIFVPGADNEFLWRSERDGYNHFYRYNTDGKLLNQVSKGQWVVKDFIGFHNGDDFAVFTAYQNNALDQEIFVSPITNNQSSKLSKDPGVHHGQMNESGYILDSYSNMDSPRKIKIITADYQEVATILDAKDPFELVDLAQTELQTIKAKNGSEMNLRIIKPHDFDPNKKYPALLYVYNGPGVQLIQNSWLASANLWMHYLANQGYIVFTVDGRGSENRGMNFEQVTFRNLGHIEMIDQLTAVDHMKSTGYVLEDRVAVHGWSYGGFMTTSLMLNYPKVFTSGVGGGPVIDWKFYETMYTERYMDTPQSNPKGFKNTSLLDKVDQLEGKLMLIHGAVDDVVVWQHSLEFVRECVSKGVQLDYFAYPEHPHNVRGKDRVHLMRKVIDYIQTNNQ